MTPPDTRQAVQAALAMIKAVHHSEVIDNDKVGAWVTLLGDLPPASIVQGTVEVLRTSVYPPKPADIRGAAIPPQLSATEAWLEFVDSMREREVLDQHGDRRHVLPSWSSDVAREAGEPIAGQVVAMIDRGEADDFVLRNTYCERYKRLMAAARQNADLDRLDMGDRDPSVLRLANGGTITEAQLVALDRRDRPALPTGAIAYDDAEAADKQRQAAEQVEAHHQGAA